MVTLTRAEENSGYQQIEGLRPWLTCRHALHALALVRLGAGVGRGVDPVDPASR
jgi:hypothetical protein